MEPEGAMFSALGEAPGCVATGGTVEETEKEIRAAIRFHIEGEDGLPVPEPTSIVEYFEL